MSTARKWTAAEIPSQQGKLAIVTGANSGIGWNTALELARAGAEVILTARTEAKGRDAVRRINRELPSARVRAEILDLASLRSVRDFAARVGSAPKLDLLINNAGVMAIPQRQVTEDGFEMQFGTNFLGHFSLSGLLMPALARSAAPRVTTVSSGAAAMGLRRINLEDLQWQRSYGPWKAYCQSKLADLMFTLELARRCGAVQSKLVSTAAHPGYARTNLQTSGPAREPSRIERIMESFMSHDAAHGALPTLRAATATDAASGSYYAPDRMAHLKGNPILIAPPKPARNAETARRLWALAEQLTGIQIFFPCDVENPRLAPTSL
jgi:NAD(P)-dependent dehydrogenase (short-subunit alcohol dehydrogenase family)